jgi:hypothetical protein
MLAARDGRMKLDTDAARRDRADLAALAKPQGGVDALANAYPRAQGAPQGVADNGDRSARAVPVTTMRQP